VQNRGEVLGNEFFSGLSGVGGNQPQLAEAVGLKADLDAHGFERIDVVGGEAANPTQVGRRRLRGT